MSADPKTVTMQRAAVMSSPEAVPAFPRDASTQGLVMDTESIDKMMRVAEMMASARVTIPNHLAKSPSDCLAVVMQAMQWQMNPFAVAQKTHLSPGGQLGYEAQLVNAVIVSSRALRDQPDFEFLGNWDKILGKVQERQSDKGGKYYVAAWNKADEEGLGVIVRATLAGESRAREVKIMLSQCYPRFSTQWATDPQQQITYVAVRKFARRYAPGAILGVYTPDELQETREMGDAERIEPASRAPEVLPNISDAEFAEKLPTLQAAIKAGRKTADTIIATLNTKYSLTEEQKTAIRGDQNSSDHDEWIAAYESTEEVDK